LAGEILATKATQRAVTGFLLFRRIGFLRPRRHSGSVLVTTIGFKRVGLAFAVLVALGLGAIAVSSFVISTEAARDAVKAQIHAATGLDPTIRGEVRVSIFPPDTVTFRNVVLGDENGSPALVAENLTAHLSLWPLLRGHIEIADISLERPRIAITFDAAGRSNWASLLDALAGAMSPNADRSVLSFSEIHIKEGTIVVNRGGVEETATQVDLSLAWPSIAKTFAATGQFVWRDKPLEASLAIGDFYAALMGTQTGMKVRVSGAPIKLAFDGTMSNRPTLKMNGMLAADAASLRDTFRWLGMKPLPGDGFGRFTLKAQTSIGGGSIAFSGVDIALDGNVAEGVLTFSSDERQMLKGTLAVEGLNLTPYASAFQQLASNTRDWNRPAMTFDDFAAVDLDLRLSAANVTLGTTRIGRTALAANLRAGDLTLTIGESQAFGGIVTGSISVARAGEGAELKSQVMFRNVDLDHCLRELVGIRRIEGKGDINFFVEGAGTSMDAVTRTLNGSATLTANDGALTGFDAEQLLRRLERRPLSGAGDFRSGRTPYERLNIALKLEHGIATTENVRIEGPAVRLVLEGSASIPNRDIDLTGTARLVGSGGDASPGFELPFVVQGPWDDPIMLPDTQSLISRSGAAAPLLDAVRNNKGAADAVRGAIERLTGTQPAPGITTTRGGAQ
jgi:AsmA protein